MAASLRDSLKAAIEREAFDLAAQLKQQIASSSMVSDKVWAGSSSTSFSQKVTAEGLRETASDVWRDVVNGINQTFADDLDAAEQLVLVTLRRAAQMGTPLVQIEAARKVTFPCGMPRWYGEMVYSSKCKFPPSSLQESLVCWEAHASNPHLPLHSESVQWPEQQGGGTVDYPAKARSIVLGCRPRT